MTKPLNLVLVLFTSSLIASGCDGSHDECPPGEKRVARGYGADCVKSDSIGQRNAETIEGIGLSAINIEDECFNTTNQGIYNNNGFSIQATITAGPIPPGWPASGVQTFTVPANTSTSEPMIIGKTKYKTVQDCRFINFNLVTVAR